jgi:hypothetical protein
MASRARRLHLLVEGQTEETVVRNVVEPYFRARGYWVTQSVLVTKKPAGRAWHHGGVASWGQIERDVRHLLRDSSLDILTTVIDYYAFPSDAPGMADRPAAGPVARVRHVEEAVAVAVGDPRFVPHLVLHELEAWVFAAAHQLADLSGDPALASALQAEVKGAGGVELIDEGPETAPSKRLARLCPGYTKTLDGPLVIADLGIVRLRACCPHMDAWLRRLGV